MAARHPRLKIRDGGYGEEDVVAPASDDRITLDHLMAFSLEESQESPLHFLERVLAFGRGVSYERVLDARGVPASFPLGVQGPEIPPATRAALAFEAFAREELDLVNVFHVFRPVKYPGEN